jgi:hypothetical protein
MIHSTIFSETSLILTHAAFFQALAIFEMMEELQA